MKNELLKYCVSFFAGIFFANCANQLPPGGGDIDRTPPEIIEIIPEDGTTNFEGEYFEIGLSEYVDKRTVQDAIFISPAIEGNLELDWSGKYVRVYFPDTLRSNTTYVVTIGTDVVDYNNKNRMAEAVSFTFSTGPEIDRRVVTGRVFEPEPEGILIFAYKTNRDTINPYEMKPDYISQTGNDGSFKLAGLAASGYRIFAVRDEFRDLLLQPDQDLFGAPYNEIVLSETDSLFTGMNYFLTAVDTTRPRLISAAMTDEYHILVEFTEAYDSLIVNSNNFYLFDSTANIRIDLLYAFKGRKENTEMVLVVDEDIPVDNEVYFLADTIRDIDGNEFADDYTDLAVSEAPDTIPPNVEKTFPSNNSRDVDFQNTQIDFFLNDAVDSNLVKENIVFEDTSGNSIAYTILFYDDASFNVKASERIYPQNEYRIKLDLSDIPDAAGNISDTVYTYRFKTISGLDFTGASGSVNNITVEDNPVLVLEGTERDKKIYTKKLGSSSKFNFDRVEPGKYLLWIYKDKDSSGTYNYGYPFPFVPAEEFDFYGDTLNLRPRWTVTDIQLNFKQP